MPTHQITVDPEEIVNRVDDMTAWLAIADEGGRLQYDLNHFYAAEPMVSLGSGDYGFMYPNRIEAVEPTFERSESREDRDEFYDENLPTFINAAIKRMVAVRHIQPWGSGASMTECNDCPAVFAFHDSGDKLVSSDFVGEPSSSGAGVIKNVSWQLSSAGIYPESSSRGLRTKYHLPQISPIIRFQSVTTLKDGRSVGGGITCWWNGAQLMTLGKRPVLRKGDGERNLLTEFLQALLNYVKKDTNWTVELSLSDKRTGIGLATDASGAKEFLTLLSKASDTKLERRKALVHWVGGHMRRSRGGDPHFVREHLRGKQAYRINSNTFVRIYPARNDLLLACNGARFATIP